MRLKHFDFYLYTTTLLVSCRVVDQCVLLRRCKPEIQFFFFNHFGGLFIFIIYMAYHSILLREANFVRIKGANNLSFAKSKRT